MFKYSPISAVEPQKTTVREEVARSKDVASLNFYRPLSPVCSNVVIKQMAGDLRRREVCNLSCNNKTCFKSLPLSSLRVLQMIALAHVTKNTSEPVRGVRGLLTEQEACFKRSRVFLGISSS